MVDHRGASSSAPLSSDVPRYPIDIVDKRFGARDVGFD
jgi:hypothetical protein